MPRKEAGNWQRCVVVENEKGIDKRKKSKVCTQRNTRRRSRTKKQVY